ncbi:MAG: allantoate amidohydrolase [Xanthobacteraceae bacterium]
MTETEGDQSVAGQFGSRILSWAEELAAWSESSDGLTCTYLSDAHRAVAERLSGLMLEAGLTTTIDAVGNVVGRIGGTEPDARTLILGSHYDTVRNAGKYDGRLGILTAIAVMNHLWERGQRLPYAVEVIGFAEEEGLRFPAAYLGSSAVAGKFDSGVLATRDGSGVSLDEALRAAGFDPDAIPALARRPESLLGYVELHIEQGPVLLNEGLPVGVVTAMSGAARLEVVIHGKGGHAGTVPMAMRRDAMVAAAEIILLVERRCATMAGLVGTVGQVSIPDGAANVIPGRCELSIEIGAADDGPCDAAVADIRAEIGRIATRRKVGIEVRDVSRTPAVRCTPRLQSALAASIANCGVPVRRLASGAGHDAVMFDGVTDVGMLFVRCGDDGISHSPDEAVSAEDADLAARVLLDFLVSFSASDDAF